LGVPTANIQLHRYKAPLSGVYLVEMHGLHRSYPGVANVGVRPTVESGGVKPILEVHLLDFEGDLYGRQVEVVFIEKLREEQKFSGLPALKAAIRNDIEQARRRFEQAS
jgi:riboflavin kinase/FMN adenylyltransferase